MMNRAIKLLSNIALLCLMINAQQAFSNGSTENSSNHEAYIQKDIKASTVKTAPVKKSKNNICHPKGGQYYSRTKNHTPFLTMQACLNSGGRKARR